MNGGPYVGKRGHRKLETRRAVRSYADRPVEREKLEAILEAATYALREWAQSPVIVLVESKETRDKVAALNAGAMGRDTDPFYGLLRSRSCSATRTLCLPGSKTLVLWRATF